MRKKILQLNRGGLNELLQLLKAMQMRLLNGKGLRLLVLLEDIKIAGR